MKKLLMFLFFLGSLLSAQTLTVSPTSLSMFNNNIANTNSASYSFTLSGTLLTGFPDSITVTAPTGFIISLSTSSGFAASLKVPFTSATLSGTTIYVRFNAPSATSFSGNIASAGGGATTANVAVSGTVTSTVNWSRPMSSGSMSTISWEATTDAGTTWAPSTTPTGSENIVIPGGYNDTLGIPWTLSGYVRNNGNIFVGIGGSLTFSGGTYEHAQNSGSIPLATWGTGSTCLVTGVTAANPGAGQFQNFYNFIWNCPYQSANLNLAWDNIIIGGDVTCTASGASAAFQLRLTSAASVRNITIKGNVIVNGGYLTVSGSGGAAQYNVSVGGNITVQSGKFNLCGGSGGFGTWKLLGNLSIASGAQFVVPSNKSIGTILIFAKKDGTQTYSNAGTNANLNYGVDSNATVQLNSPLAVGDATNPGYLVLRNGKFVSSSSNLLTLSAVSKDTLASSIGYVDGPVVNTIASASSNTKTFPLGKGSAFRPVIMNITQDAATSTTYTAEMFNTAPTSRTLPATIDSVSKVRYYHLTKGAGANVSSATIKLTYAADDSIFDQTFLKIAEDDGAGNWVNIGGSGSAPVTGTISSNLFTMLTSTDFVLAHRNPTGPVSLPTVTTAAMSLISATTATSGGNVTDDGNGAITGRGVCWSSVNVLPTITDGLTNDGAVSGVFTSSVTGLNPGTTYYLRAYATNSAGPGYGIVDTFTTLASIVPPTVTTDTVTSIVNITANGFGNVTFWGGAPVTSRGICWSTSPNPTNADSNFYNLSGSGLGSFNVAIGYFTYGTTYHYRAFATNSAGTGYGSDKTFTAPSAQTDVYKIVDKNGIVGVNCDYTTLQAAFNAVTPNYTGHWVIYVKNGIYNEKDTLSASRINVVLVGQSRDSTIISYDDYSGKNPFSNATQFSYTVAIDASDFQAQNITIRNTSASSSQAVALRVSGDRQAYYNCKMLSWIDTYYTYGNLTGPDRIYNNNCYIEGTNDFIFGHDVAVFDSCVLYCNKVGGSITAAATEAGFKFGYVMMNDSVQSPPSGSAGADGVIFGTTNPNAFYLGRPWLSFPQTVYLNCTEPATLDAAGWTTFGPAPALYSEYNCSGPGYIPSRTQTWTGQPTTITSGQAATYTLQNIFSKFTAAPPYSYVGNWVPSKFNVVITSVNDNNEAQQVPTSFALRQNFPNPFNPTTQIQFSVPKDGHATLKVYNLIGQEIAVLFDGIAKSGQFITKEFSGNRLSSGVYIARLQFKGNSLVQRMLLLK